MTETPRPTEEEADAPAAHDEDEHGHTHDHGEELRGHNLSMQCWRLGQRARTAEEWQRAVEAGRQAVELLGEAPEPRFNLAVALTGLAHAADDAEARRAAAEAFDRGLEMASQAGPQYCSSAVSLLEKRPDLAREPAAQYALGTHLAALGKLVRARRALESAAADPTLGDLARTALEATPEPVQARAAPVGRNDPCPCGSGKKYKKCHGA